MQIFTKFSVFPSLRVKVIFTEPNFDGRGTEGKTKGKYSDLTSFGKVFLKGSPKDENTVINYLRSCCSKPVRPSFIFVK